MMFPLAGTSAPGILSQLSETLSTSKLSQNSVFTQIHFGTFFPCERDISVRPTAMRSSDTMAYVRTESRAEVSREEHY